MERRYGTYRTMFGGTLQILNFKAMYRTNTVRRYVGTIGSGTQVSNLIHGPKKKITLLNFCSQLNSKALVKLIESPLNKGLPQLPDIRQ
jgi:hypothetical protein